MCLCLKLMLGKILILQQRNSADLLLTNDQGERHQ